MVGRDPNGLKEGDWFSDLVDLVPDEVANVGAAALRSGFGGVAAQASVSLIGPPKGEQGKQELKAAAKAGVQQLRQSAPVLNAGVNIASGDAELRTSQEAAVAAYQSTFGSGAAVVEQSVKDVGAFLFGSSEERGEVLGRVVTQAVEAGVLAKATSGSR